MHSATLGRWMQQYRTGTLEAGSGASIQPSRRNPGVKPVLLPESKTYDEPHHQFDDGAHHTLHDVHRGVQPGSDAEPEGGRLSGGKDVASAIDAEARGSPCFGSSAGRCFTMSLTTQAKTGLRFLHPKWNDRIFNSLLRCDHQSMLLQLIRKTNLRSSQAPSAKFLIR